MKLPAVPIDVPMVVAIKDSRGQILRYEVHERWKDYFVRQYALVEALRVKAGL